MNKRKLWPIVRGAILLALVILGFWLCSLGTDLQGRFQEMNTRAVSVEGTVTYVDEYYDVTEGTQYESTIVYTYQGESYVYTRSQRYKVGDKVNLRIDPQDPEVVVSVVQGNSIAAGVFGSLFLGIAAAMLGSIKVRPAVEDPLAYQLCTRVGERLSWRFFLVTGAALLVTFSGYDAGSILLVALVLLCLGIARTMRMIKDLNLAKNGKHRFGSVSIVNRITGEDYGKPRYYLGMAIDGGKSWKREVSGDVYNASSTLDTLEAIFLSGKKPEALIDPVTKELF